MATPALKITTSYTLTPKNLVHNLETVGKKSKKEYTQLVFKDIVEHAVREGVKAAKPTYTGALERSIQRDSWYNADGAGIGPDLRKVPYALAVDGTGGVTGWPNVTSLRKWVETKLKPTASSNRRNTVSNATYCIGKYISVNKAYNPKYYRGFMRAIEDEAKRRLPIATRELAEHMIKDIQK